MGKTKKEITIKDKRGNFASLGDLVCIFLPEKHFSLNGVYFGDSKQATASEKKIIGRLSLRLSQGIGVKVEKVETKDAGEIFPIWPGQWIRLRVRAWDWYKIENHKTADDE